LSANMARTMMAAPTRMNNICKALKRCGRDPAVAVVDLTPFLLRCCSHNGYHSG
jgi:hypothetical protein